jgi:probable HAF family extracellular repeat protein
MRLSGRLLMLLLVTFFSSATVCNAASGPKYTITDLGTLGGNSSYAYGINISGHVTGQSPPTLFSNTHAFYYDGQMHDLGALGSSGDARLSFSAGSKINDSNQIVGTTLDATARPQAYLWDAKHGMQSLGLFNTNGVAINALGQIVGETASITTGQVGQAFIWDATAGAKWLPLLPGCFLTNGTAINDSSTVVGFCQATNNSIQAFVWDSIHETQALAPGTLESLAWSINNKGQISGSIVVSLGVGRAVKWAGTSGMQLLPLIADKQGNLLNTDGYSINDQGDIVGIASQNAALWIGSAGYLLDDLIPTGSGWHLIQANAINNKGQIVGYGVINSQTHAFLLIPVKVCKDKDHGKDHDRDHEADQDRDHHGDSDRCHKENGSEEGPE